MNPSPRYERDYIVLEDYVIYMDMIYYGSQEEKDQIAFKMMDIQGQQKIYLEDYTHFWIKFLEMYGELLQSKFVYDEETKQVSEMTFS